VTAPGTELRVEISTDRLGALLCVEPSALNRNWDLKELKKACDSASLPLSDAVLARLEELLIASKRPAKQDRFPIAGGIPPRPGVARRLELLVAAESLVQVDSVVARIHPASPAVDGTDVFGRPVAADAFEDLPFLPGEHVVVRDDWVRSAMPGLFQIRDGVPSIEPASIHPGDVDPVVGVVESIGVIAVTGSVKDGGVVRSGQTVIVSGAVEAARVSASVSVVVAGGIVQRHAGKIIAGRLVRAHFAHDATILCGGDVVVGREVTNSKVECRGRLVATVATIVGGEIIATGGVEVARIGVDSSAKAVLVIGCDLRLQRMFDRLMPEVTAGRKRAEHVRKMVLPLMSNQKQLTGAQKEKATELLYDADQLQSDTDRKLRVLRTRFEASQALSRAELVASEVIHAGTTVRFPGVETTLRTTLKGPLRMFVEGTTSPRIVMQFADSPQVHPLESRPVANDAMMCLRKLKAA
jgi:uncharacterized protein (DUF342 family)